MPDLSALLKPTTVALIGAAEDTNILRGRILNILKMHDFTGRLYPVNRNHDVVQGLKAYPSIDAVPEPVDLAALIIPADAVPDELERCGQAGIKAVLILASGFAEEPGEHGNALQDRIRDISRAHDMIVAGPNSEGFSNLAAKLCMTFSPAMELDDTPLVPAGDRKRHLAVVAQSGGVGYSFYDRGRPKELAFSHIVTTGNEVCVESLQVVDYLLDDDATSAIIMFMEDIKTPKLFIPVAEKALRAGKPLMAAKIGRTEAGARAAQSHTAAMAGDFSAYQAMFRHYGIVEIEDQDEAVDFAQGFCCYAGRLPAGKRVGIFTASGGGGGWMADACADACLSVPELDVQTRAAIDPHLPAYGTSQNPVDGTAQVIRQKGYAEMCEMIAGSPEIDAVIAVTSARNPVGWQRERDKVLRVGRETKKPIVFWAYTLPNPDVQALCGEAGIPLSANMRNVPATIAAMADYRRFRENFLKPATIDTSPRKYDRADATRALEIAGEVLCEYEARRPLAAYGIGSGSGGLAANAEEAVVAAAMSNKPVVLKIQSPDIPHKSEAKGIAINVTGAQAVATAYEAIIDAANAYNPDADIHGVLVQPMAADGVEVILGIHRDDTFGPLLMLGLGGIHVEILGDKVFAPVPLTEPEASELIERLKAKALLSGARGTEPADIDALIDIIVRLSNFAADHADQIEEIDLNPVRVHPEGEGEGGGVSVLDALIIQRRTP